jgi:hypothetical protein
VKVGDLVKEIETWFLEGRGSGLGIIVAIYAGDRIVESGSTEGNPYTFIEVLYSDGELFKHSNNAYLVISD